MALETGTYISDLVSTNPVASDNISQGDDHIRLLKSTIKATFPNVSGAVTPTHTELNYVDGVTSSIQTQIDGKAATSHTHAASDISDSTSAGRAILTAADASAQRTSLGLGSLATKSSLTTSDLTGFSVATADIQNGAITTVKLGGDITTAGKALLDDADAAAQRTTLGLGSAATLTAGTSANNLVQLNGSAQLPAVSGALLTNLPPQVNVQKFTSSGTWTKPSGATTVLVRLWGAGAGGQNGQLGSPNLNGGIGGGGGSYLEYLFAADFLSATQAVTIGAGGAGAASSSSSQSYGSNGGNTTFSVLTAAGGTTTTGGISPDTLHATSAGSPYWNGASPGLPSNGIAVGGNSSYKGGGAGGGGGGENQYLTPPTNPAAGGTSGSINQGGGAAPGTSSAASPTAGSNGTMFQGGGGGGSANTATTAGRGGNGGIAGGGGGGGSNRSGKSNGGGGNGGNGYAEIITW